MRCGAFSNLDQSSPGFSLALRLRTLNAQFMTVRSNLFLCALMQDLANVISFPEVLFTPLARVHQYTKCSNRATLRFVYTSGGALMPMGDRDSSMSKRRLQHWTCRFHRLSHLRSSHVRISILKKFQKAPSRCRTIGALSTLRLLGNHFCSSQAWRTRSPHRHF